MPGDSVTGDVSAGDVAADPTRTYVVTHLPGDGVGPEVTDVARACVDAVGGQRGFAVDWRHCGLGGRHYLATGEVLPDSVLDELRKSDAILLGAVGTPDVPPGVLERGLLLRLRFELDLYVNLRPSKLRQGVGGAVGKHALADLDFVIVRENTEGMYAGAGGTVHRGTEFETATEESLNTWAGVWRCVRYAAKLAARRTGHLTLVHKTNVLTHAGDLWQRIATEVAAAEGVQLGYAHVDAACLWMVDDPGRFDVIVTDNLFGDIISDLGAALTGGLGYAPSGNLNPDRTGPSVFEPVHGSAPDIAGKGLANPAGAVLSAGLMLAHLGEDDAAADLDAAVNAVLAEGAPTSTRAWEQALLARLGAARGTR
jgi:3-isopropylmalate dehydrogenase